MAEVVVKVASGHSISEITAAYPVVLDSTLLASRGIYLVRATDSRYLSGSASTQQLADLIAANRAVVYAEPNYLTKLNDSQYHAWPDGTPTDAGTYFSVLFRQAAVTSLQLTAVQGISRGGGVTVAVLDTGVDPSQSFLSSRLVPGWDYVHDDSNTNDVADGVDDNHNGHTDEALGHGTFVAGIVNLVAPDARILPERVLDSDGEGNIFVVAQAILDATDSGANVINLSLGTSDVQESHLLDSAVSYAQSHGVLVVAAAGNDGVNSPHYPAATSGVLSVGALAESGSGLASFSDYGSWVDVAAPGSHIGGPVISNHYVWWTGTSMAAPFVAGEAAVIRAAAPTLTAQKITTAIESGATAIPRSQVGYGAINTLQSLKAATGGTSAPTPPAQPAPPAPPAPPGRPYR